MDYIFEFDKADIDEKKKKHSATKRLSFATVNGIAASSFRINIKNFNTIHGRGVELKCSIVSGKVNKGDLIKFNGRKGKIENIEKYGKQIDIAGYPWTGTSEEITILISGIEKEVIYTGEQMIDVVKQNNRTSSETFLYEISDVFTISGRGIVLTGRILEGTISIGDKVKVDGKQGVILGIEKFRHLLDTASANDGTIGLLISGLQRGDASINSVVKKASNGIKHIQTKTDIPLQSEENPLSTYSISSTGKTKEQFVRIKPQLPIMIKDAPTRRQNQLMKAISKIYGNGSIEYDGLGDISKIETDSRIYIVNGVDAPHGLLLYVDMNDASWRRNFRDIVNLYKYEYAGNFDPTVITVINSSMSDNLEVKELEEMELRDSLNDLGLRGDDYPVIFCEVDKINNAAEIQKGGKLHRSIVEAIVALDEYFVTP